MGFRFTAVSIAEHFGVSGWVMNLAGSAVELVAEQEKKVLEEFLDRLEDQFSGYITDRDIRWVDASGEFRGFEIR